MPIFDSYHFTFIDGCFNPASSQLDDLPHDIITTDVAQTYLHIPAHTHLKKPLYLSFITTQARETNLRTHIVMGSDSQASIIENYTSLTPEQYCTQTKTELTVGENAKIEHIKLLQESPVATHTGLLQVQQQANSHFTAHSFALGGKQVRSDTEVQLNAENADCTLNGLYCLRDQQKVEHHTLIDHVKSHSTSREYYKGVLADRAKALFEGKLIVQPAAQKSDAQQTNKNLLLSDYAEIDTRPTLQIYADDVKCAHGATVGRLDEEALFYLRSRGLDKTAAHNALIHAFVGDMLDRITLTALREQLYAQIQF